MNYYLTPWTWNTSEGLPFWEVPDAIGLVDLRPPGQAGPGPTPSGFAFAAFLNQITNPDAIHLGDSLAGLQNKSVAETALGLGVGELVATTILDAVWELLLQHADPTGATRWKPIMPTRQGAMELHLGGHSLLRSETYSEAAHPLVLDVEREDYRRVREDTLQRVTRGIRNRDPLFHRQYLQSLVEKYGIPFERFIPAGLPTETPIPHGSQIIEAWPTTGTTISSGQDNAWTEVTDDLTVATDGIHQTGNPDTTEAWGRCDVDLAGADQDGKVEATDMVRAGGANPELGVTVRYAAAADTCYFATLRDASSDFIRLYQRITGSNTQLASAGITLSIPDQDKVSINGSTLKSFFNTVEQSSVTDTAITGNTRVGVFSYRSDNSSVRATSDDGEWNDLGAGAKRRRVGAGAGWATRR